MHTAVYDHENPRAEALASANCRWIKITMNGSSSLSIFFPDGTDPARVEAFAAEFNNIQEKK
jgi:hypothetical protein